MSELQKGCPDGFTRSALYPEAEGELLLPIDTTWSAVVDFSTAAVEIAGFISQGKDSDSSYTVSGMSSAGMEKNTPRPTSTQRSRIVYGLLMDISVIVPVKVDALAPGGVRLNVREQRLF